MNRTGRWFVEFAMPPIGFAVCAIAIWWLVIITLRVPEYIAPTPAAVVLAIGETWRISLPAMLHTSVCSLCGLALTLIVGTVASILFAQFTLLRRGVYPYAVFFQTVPLVAIAPIITIMFGYGFQSIAICSFVVSVFPMVANATSGLAEIDPRLQDLFTMYNATPWQRLWKLKIPNALPYFFIGARISAGLAVIGAVVGEFFVGLESSGAGLGSLIYVSAVRDHIARLYAYVLATVLVGAVFVGVTHQVGELVMKAVGVPRGRNTQ
jgi:NitT/TauT family transport system permease protein